MSAEATRKPNQCAPTMTLPATGLPARLRGLGRVFRKPKAKRVFAGERISGLGRGQA